MTCTVGMFGDIYQSIRRVDTYRLLDMATCMRVAPNADAKDYQKYLEGQSSWLHRVGRAVMLDKKKVKATSEDIKKNTAKFLGLFKGNVHG